MFIGLLILYCAIVVPFRIGFSEDATGKPCTLSPKLSFSSFCTSLSTSSTSLLIFITYNAGGRAIFENIIDALFGIDIVLNFFCGFVDRSGNIEWRFSKIALRYLKTWFLLDLVSTLPFDNIALFIVSVEDDGNDFFHSLLKGTKVLKILRLIRLLRLLRLMKIEKLDELVQNIEEDYGVDFGYLNLFKLMGGICFLVHIIGCLWMLVGTNGYDEYDRHWIDNWADGNTTLLVNYTLSVYYIMTTMSKL
jgi:hypothetical protein